MVRCVNQNTSDTVVVAPVLPARVRHFAFALAEAGRLRSVVAGYVYRPDGAFERCCAAGDRWLGTRISKGLERRSLTGVGAACCHRAISAEVTRAARGRWRWPVLSSIRTSDIYHQAIDRHASRVAIDRRARLVVAREDGALASFRRAHDLGLRTVYDLPTAHFRCVWTILAREEQAFPGICGFPQSEQIFTAPRIAHKEAELAAADHVVVGSRFVAQSLTDAGFPASAVTVLPSACEPDWLPCAAHHDASGNSGNLVLHVGRLSLRKGTHRLLRAWKRLAAHRTHRLRLIGDMYLSDQFLDGFRGCYEHIGRVPRSELRRHYAQAAMFVLPAAAEGFAAVILEALSCGVPVVASRSSGADGFLEHGQEALLHDFGDDEQLCEQLEWMLSHPVERLEMARRARAKAAAWTWGDYRRQFLETLDSFDAVRQEAGPCAVS